MTKPKRKQLDECSALVDEAKGRAVILDQYCLRAAGESDGAGSHKSFLCIQCAKDSRERELRREWLYPEPVLETLDREYTNTQ